VLRWNVSGSGAPLIWGKVHSHKEGDREKVGPPVEAGLVSVDGGLLFDGVLCV
jgi:hypothetical protein